MKFTIFLIFKTALILAIQSDNIEIVQLLMKNPKIDVNIPYIFNYSFIYKITIKYFYDIS